MSLSKGALLLLAACSSGAGDTPPPDPASLVECALAGAASFARDCAVERTRAGDVQVLVVRHPDGGFRRFEVLGDGRGVASADGAEAARVAFNGDGVEVAVGADRYRFPTTIAGDER